MNRIALIGYRGSGKSTVGPLVAEKLGWAFADIDRRIAESTGKSIAQIFTEQGEPAFRTYESDYLYSLLQQEPLVIAPGGGIVLNPSHCIALRRQCMVFWLDVPSGLCWERIRGDPLTPQTRPDLASGGLAEVEGVMRARQPLYENTAHQRIDGACSPESVADAILQAWQSRATA